MGRKFEFEFKFVLGVHGLLHHPRRTILQGNGTFDCSGNGNSGEARDLQNQPRRWSTGTAPLLLEQRPGEQCTNAHQIAARWRREESISGAGIWRGRARRRATIAIAMGQQACCLAQTPTIPGTRAACLESLQQNLNVFLIVGRESRSSHEELALRGTYR